MTLLKKIQMEKNRM